MSQRVKKKLLTPFDVFNPSAAILVVNLFDPQLNTIQVFLDAIKDKNLPFFIVGNKTDLVYAYDALKVREALGMHFIPTCLLTREGVDKVKKKMVETFVAGDRIIILGVFNSGKTSLINTLTGLDLEVGRIPGTTLEFTEYECGKYSLIDTVGQITDISKPLLVSVDLSKCKTPEERIRTVMEEEAKAIIDTIDYALPSIIEVVQVIKEQINRGHKVVVTGAGASALVAMEMAGQGIETGVPIVVFTNNLADAQPISFAKGTGEEEMGLSKYIASCVNEGDVVIGVSASGGTGSVYYTLKLAKEKGAITVAITENPDSPIGDHADYCIKSSGKPEGPSASKTMMAHMSIAHALMLTLAEERGITADQSVGYMLPEKIQSKKIGIK